MDCETTECVGLRAVIGDTRLRLEGALIQMNDLDFLASVVIAMCGHRSMLAGEDVFARGRAWQSATAVGLRLSRGLSKKVFRLLI